MQKLKKGVENLSSLNFYSNYHFGTKYPMVDNYKKQFKKECLSPFDFNNTMSPVDTNSFIIYVFTSKRNTRLTLCDSSGKNIYTITMGSLGNKKSKRGNVYFVKDLCFRFLQELEKYKFNSFVLCLNGFGRSRRPVVRFFSKTKLRYKCSYIIDVTSKPHNGCRLRSSRRL